MDYDEKNSDELEAELYSRIHHDKPEADGAVIEPPAFQTNRTVTKHSIVNNSRLTKKPSTKNRKKANDKKCHPNPFAIASAMNSHIPKRFTTYTSYLSQVDSQPIDLPPAPVQANETAAEIDPEIERKLKARRPNPFNQGFNRADEKMKRLQLIQAKKARANEIREKIEQQKTATVDEIEETKNEDPNAIDVADSDSDDSEVYIYPPEEPTVISSDEENANDTVEKEAPEPIANLHDDCDDINVDYDKRLSRHDDPFGGIDVAHLNSIISQSFPSKNLPPIDESADHFAKPPQRASRQSLKRSYHVTETDFAATDVYESDRSDMPESRKAARVLSESEGSEIETAQRSKRMRKRKASGTYSNRGSDCISSDDSDDDVGAYLEPEKTTRPYYLHKGEGVATAVTKYSKRLASRRSEQSRDIGVAAVDWSDDDDDDDADSPVNKAMDEQEKGKENWIVTDEVGETDAIELKSLINGTDAMETNVQEKCTDKNESTADKDDDNSVRSKSLVIHPEMGWNDEMKAFYHDSWGGENHNALAIRRQMPRRRHDWPLNPVDLRSNFDVLKTVKCHNCRENGHRMAFCPQPKKEIVCHTCGNAGHTEARCPNTICLRCGEKTNFYVRGCKNCSKSFQLVCQKCRRHGHNAENCPDNWRAYHNTTDSVSMPRRLPPPDKLPERYCSVCARRGHRADYCFNYHFEFQEHPTIPKVYQYERMYPTDQPPVDNSFLSTPYAMFEEPRENFKFVWNVNESSDRVYGRFMQATNIKRDAADDVRSKRRRKKAKKSKMNEQLVLNPMNEQNIREKPKKQFAKNFYEEPATTHLNQPLDVTENSESGAGANCVVTTENGTLDNDVEMEELEPIATTVSNSELAQSEQSEEDKIMQEAIEVDQLRTRSKSFSFSEEMVDLTKSKTNPFNLSFIATADDREPQVAGGSIPTKASARKMRKEEEIERLTEMEISLHKLKDKLNESSTYDNIVLNVSSEPSIHSVIHDSDSNYSFGEFYTEAKSNDQKKSNGRRESENADYIPLPSDVDARVADDISYPMNSVNPVNSAKIFLTKEHARLLLSTDAGNELLSKASSTHQVKVRMDWENCGNVLIVVGSTANQNKFHADLIQFLVEMCKKVRIKNETFQQIPKSKVALIRFIREQFALLEQPLGNVNELYKIVTRNESLKSKNGTKNADRARKNLNIILMGRAGLRDGRLHLTGLESNLKFLLENNKDMMTKHTRAEIYQHYRYIFSPFEHDDYPDLISEYEEMKRAKSFPPLNIDKNLLEIKISVKDDASGDLNRSSASASSCDLNRAKQKLMRLSNDNESPKDNQEPEEVESTATVDVVIPPEPKTPTREAKNHKREPRTPKQPSKSPKPDTKTPNVQTNNIETVDLPASTPSVNVSSNVNKNEVWSLKCKEIIEQCRQRNIKSAEVVKKLNVLSLKASQNQLTYGDYKTLEQSLNKSLNKLN